MRCSFIISLLRTRTMHFISFNFFTTVDSAAVKLAVKPHLSDLVEALSRAPHLKPPRLAATVVAKAHPQLSASTR